MNTLTKYSIAHKGLSIGIHQFDFKMDDRFFDAFEGSEILKGEADVKVTLNKQSSLLSLEIEIDAKVDLTCDRCLEEFWMPIHYEGTLHVRYSETEQESDGELMWISPAETEISLAQYFYESICLSLPYQRVHPMKEDGTCGCNPDMLARFSIVSEEEFEQIAGEEKAHSPWGELDTIAEKLKK